MQRSSNPYVRPRQAFIGFADQVAPMLGSTGGLNGSGWISCRCPVHDDRRASLSLRDSPFGLVAKCFVGCSSAEILRAIEEMLRTGAVLPPPAPAQAPVDMLACAERIWVAGLPHGGTIIEPYLRDARGVTVSLPATLKFSPRLWHRDSNSYPPAMLALVVNVAGEMVGIQRTWLRPDGSGKADVTPSRMSLGPVGGGAVRLAEGGSTLIIGEGIETSLSAMQRFGRPAWAALTTTGMASVSIPASYTTILIAADHDVSGTGQRAAEKLRRRLLHEGRNVRVEMPATPGADFNDVAREVAA